MIKAYNEKTTPKSAFFFVILIKNADPTSPPLVRGIFVSNTEPIIDSAPLLKKGVEEEFKNDFSSFTPLGFGVYTEQKGVEIGLGISNLVELWRIPILISLVEGFQLVKKIVEFVDQQGGQGGSQPSVN